MIFVGTSRRKPNNAFLLLEASTRRALIITDSTRVMAAGIGQEAA
jgi:hypothetical protein